MVVGNSEDMTMAEISNIDNGSPEGRLESPKLQN